MTANHIIDPPPCGYFLTEEQYSGPRAEGTVGLRLGIHGIAQETRPAGHIVRMAQALRGLIPTILDPADVSPEPIVAALRLFECPHVVASPRSFAGSVPAGSELTRTLTIRNIAPEADEPLNWTITEAVSDCSSPSDLTWASASPTSGTTPSAHGSDDVTITLSAAGLSGPSMLTGVLCLSSNDAGEGTIAIPLKLNVRRP